MEHHFTSEETQWLLKRRKELPREPWPTLHKVFHKMFPEGIETTVNSLQVHLSGKGEQLLRPPFVKEENDWLQAYRPTQWDDDSKSTFHIQYQQQFPHIKRSEAALVKQSNYLLGESGQLPRRDWTIEELDWIQKCNLQCKDAYEDFVGLFPFRTYYQFHPRWCRSRTKMRGRTWKKEEDDWILSCSMESTKGAHNAFLQHFQGSGRTYASFKAHRRELRSRISHPASVAPARFGTLPELDTIDPYLMLIGRGQSDENRIKEVEHEKENKEETILKDA
jgi:hypothetical protein